MREITAPFEPSASGFPVGAKVTVAKNGLRGYPRSSATTGAGTAQTR